MSKDVVTPKQVARAIGVSESSVKRWCDDGVLPAIRTAGGHRRLPISGVLRFLRDTGRDLVRPELLGLPSSVGAGTRVTERAEREFREALVKGEEETARRVIIDLYLARQSIGTICDEIVARSFHKIGDLWACHEVDVYQERRGCQIAVRVLLELRSLIAPPTSNAPIALGGAGAEDNYTLPTTMVELVLRDAGWNAQSLGCELPYDSLCKAIEENRPPLFWMSVSHIRDEAEFLEAAHQLYVTAESCDTALAIGGRALTPEIRREVRFTVFCDNFAQLADFAAPFQKRIRIDEEP